jgi:hypothetical protein
VCVCVNFVSNSFLFTTPWFLLGLVVFQFFFLGYIVWFGKVETRRLITTIHTLYQPWKQQYRIHVTFRQVAHTKITRSNISHQHHHRRRRDYSPTIPSSLSIPSSMRNTSQTQQQQRQQQQQQQQGPFHSSTTAGSFCFVLVFAIVGEDDTIHPLDDDQSAGTIETNIEEDY